MSRWCVDQVISLRAGTELNLCAAWAWEVQLVVACIDDAPAASNNKQAQDTGYVGRSVDDGRRVRAKNCCPIRGLKGDRKCAVVGALLRALPNTSNQQWFATLLLLWLVAVLEGLNGHTFRPFGARQIANRA